MVKATAKVKCVAIYLPFFIADLIEETCDQWELFLLLIDINTTVIALASQLQAHIFKFNIF